MQPKEANAVMSLLDALLLEPAPFETFVAYRADSIKGSGTISDPWNAATKWARPITLSLLNRTGFEVLATRYPQAPACILGQPLRECPM